jgi:hypothetical protein
LATAQSTDQIDTLKRALEELRHTRLANSDNVNARGTQLEEEIRDRTTVEKGNHANLLREVGEMIAENEQQSKETRTQLQIGMAASKNQFESHHLKLRTDSDRTLKQMTDQHWDRISGMSRDLENLKAQREQSGAVFQKKLKDKCAQHQSSIDESVRTSEKEREKRSSDYDEMKAFYEEKLSVLTKKRDDAMLIFQQRPPRQSEIDVIEQLEATLQTKAIQLSNAIRDYQEFKLLLAQTEKEGHSRFGKGPKIGILTPGQRVPVH